MYVVLQEQVGAFSIEQRVTLVVRIADYSIPSGIVASILTAKGSMIVATAPGVPAETGGPSADGLVWTSDSTEILGGRWAAPGGGGGDVDLTNKSGSDQIAGTVVIHEADYDNSFKLTTTLRDRRVIGVLSEDIANGATGKVAVAGKIVTVKVQGNVSRGQWLIASATTGRAQADGYTRPNGTIGMALTEYAGGGAGTVSALIVVDHYLGASAGKHYMLGGSDGAAVTTSQALNFTSETVSVIAVAALTSVRSSAAGASGSDRGISFGGTNSTLVAGGQVIADRILFSTEVTAAITGANLLAARTGGQTVSAPLAAYFSGGVDTGGTNQTTGYKTPWATETTAAQASANLTTARRLMGYGVQSSLAGYLAGGYTAAVVATAEKLLISTETMAALASANLSAARDGAAGLCDTISGYFSGGTTGAVSTTTDKMPFATDTTAAVGSAALSAARRKASGGSGALSGYVLGGSTLNTAGASAPSSPVATTDKLNYTTDTMAAAAGANLVVSLSSSASINSNV